jgi:hypothetical protein
VQIDAGLERMAQRDLELESMAWQAEYAQLRLTLIGLEGLAGDAFTPPASLLMASSLGDRPHLTKTFEKQAAERLSRIEKDHPADTARDISDEVFRGWVVDFCMHELRRLCKAIEV